MRICKIFHSHEKIQIVNKQTLTKLRTITDHQILKLRINKFFENENFKFKKKDTKQRTIAERSPYIAGLKNNFYKTTLINSWIFSSKRHKVYPQIENRFLANTPSLESSDFLTWRPLWDSYYLKEKKYLRFERKLINRKV